MVKKFFKTTPLKTYYPNSDLEGPIFIFGRMGGGKSVSAKSIIEGFHDNKGYKVWDLYGGERNEGLYWTTPSTEKTYWDKLKILAKFSEEFPKQYKVNMLYPYFESGAVKKLPIKKVGEEFVVNSKYFTISIKDITVDDIKMVIGNPSENSKFHWEELQNKLDKHDNVQALDYYSEKQKCDTTILYKNFILPMIRERFLQSEYCSTNIDLISEAKNQEAITVLCLDFVPEKFHLFVINYFCSRLSDLIDDNKIPKKNIGFIREAATFFRATDDAVIEDRLKIFKSNMAHYIRMGRRGFYFCLDCQSPYEVKGLVEGASDYVMMFRTSSTRDKDEMCAELIKTGRMLRAQANELDMLEKGQCFIAESGAPIVRKVQVILPRSAFWKKEFPNFYKTFWESHGGDWKVVTETMDMIEEETKKIKEKYKQKREEESQKKKNLKEEYGDDSMAEETEGEEVETENSEVPEAKIMPPVMSMKDFFGGRR